MRQTPNLSLKLPDLTDYVNIEDINENMETIDTEIGTVKSRITSVFNEISVVNIAGMTTVNFENLDLDKFKILRVILKDGKSGTTTALTGTLRLNNVSSSIYAYKDPSSQAPLFTNAITILPGDSSAKEFGTVNIVEINNDVDTFKKVAVYYGNLNTAGSVSFSDVFFRNTNLITSINFTFSGPPATGKIILEGVRR